MISEADVRGSPMWAQRSTEKLERHRAGDVAKVMCGMSAIFPAKIIVKAMPSGRHERKVFLNRCIGLFDDQGCRDFDKISRTFRQARLSAANIRARCIPERPSSFAGKSYHLHEIGQSGLGRIRIARFPWINIHGQLTRRVHAEQSAIATGQL